MSEETLKKLNDIHLLYSMPYKVENMRAEHYAINEYEKLVYSQIKEIERLKIQVSARETEYERLHSIIKEAIEYVKNNAMYSEEWNKCCDDLYTKDCDEVLKILQGSDKE